MSGITSSSIHLFDLHRDIFFEILGYLDKLHLFRVRSICKAMRKVVYEFVSLKGKFLIANRVDDECQRFPGQRFAYVLYTFRTRFNRYFLHSKVISELPLPPSAVHTQPMLDCPKEYIGTFGGLINRKIVAGYFFIEKQERVTKEKARGLRLRLGRMVKVTRVYYRLIGCKLYL